MGRLLLACRLIVADLRRRPAHAGVFLIAVGAAAAALAVGLSLGDATDRQYEATRAATHGPDMTILSSTTGAPTRAAMNDLASMPGVTAHGGPYLVLHTTATAGGKPAQATVEGRTTTPATVDQPYVTSGHWVRPGGAVVERGFATVLGVRVGDRVTVAGRRFPVVGIAVTAATGVYPWAEMSMGPNDGAGLIWLADTDTRALHSTESTPNYAMNLTVAHPDDVAAFGARASVRRGALTDPSVRLNFRYWPNIEAQNAVALGDTRTTLVIGGWLLAVTAAAGLTSLAALRAAEQVRRAGLLKAVGATPGLVAAVLFAEYLVLALVAAGIGLAVARLVVPGIANPTDSLLAATDPVSGGTVTAVCALALLVALLTTLGPAVRVARTATVPALAGAARTLNHPAGLTALAGLLPVPVMLGLRLAARRVRRAVLTAGGVAAAAAPVAGLITWQFQTDTVPWYGDDFIMAQRALRLDRTHHAIVLLTVALLALAALNTVVVTWSTALDARRSLAVARAFGATPGQVTGALAVAQLPSAVVGAAVGMPVGVGLYWLVAPGASTPPGWSLLLAGAGIVVAATALAAVPAGVHARRPAARVLGSPV
ncbi:MAG TPA: ABC transporter permease [Actinocatenispora sp.]